jgi:hypothetical protein
MKKANKIIYWIATAWLALGMLSTGIVQLIQHEPEVTRMEALGYQAYLLPLLGVCKVLALVAIFIPRYPLIKEWAYAGLFFMMMGAVYSHIAQGDPASDIFGPGLLLVLTVVSWYFRPAERKIAFANS